MLCCVQRNKSAERREYERLRDALAKKQEEVRKLQAQCAALDAQPEPRSCMPQPYSSEGETATEDENNEPAESDATRAAL